MKRTRDQRQKETIILEKDNKGFDEAMLRCQRALNDPEYAKTLPPNTEEPMDRMETTPYILNGPVRPYSSYLPNVTHYEKFQKTLLVAPSPQTSELMVE